MDDLDKKIENLEKWNKSVLIWYLASFAFFIVVILIYLPKVRFTGQVVFQIYLIINILVSIYWALKYLLNPPKTEYLDKKQNYYETKIKRGAFAIDIAPLIYHIPFFFGILGLLVMKTITGTQGNYIIYPISIFFWAYSIYLWWKRRNFFFSEYKRVFGTRYYSIF